MTARHSLWLARRVLPATLLALPMLTAVAKGQSLSNGGLSYGNLQPDYGSDTRVGNLRPQLEQLLNPGPPLSARPAWLIQPSIGVDVGVTDNVYQVDKPRRADVFTTISPAVVVSGDTARVNVALSYSPQIVVYAGTGSQNQVRQFFDGQARAVIVPDAVFLDVRGNISQQSLTGGLNQYQTQTYNQQNEVQTTTFSITPSAQHRFGGWALGRVSYTFSRALQDYGDYGSGYNLNSTNALGQPSYGVLGNLTTQTETGSLTSGENFGRFQDQVVVSATQYNGSGSYRGAYRREVQNELDYALTRSVTLLTGIGYQELAYGSSLNVPGYSGYRFSGPTYNVGARYAPNPDLSLQVTYGSHDGTTNFAVQGTYNPTARTRLAVSYSTGITTDLEQAQNYLNTSSVSATGFVTDRATGAPVSNVNYSGLQNGVYRLKNLTASVIFLQERDSWLFSISNQNRTTLTSAPTLIGDTIVPAGTNTTSTFATVTWQHDLAPDMSLSANAQYGITTNTGQFISSGGNQDQRTFSVGAALTKQFTETLTGSVRYIFVDQSGGTYFGTNGYGRGSYTQNTLFVGLRKSF